MEDDVIRSAWRRNFSPFDRRSIYEYAQQIVLQAPYVPTGPFDVSKSRHFIAPFNGIADPHVREVNVLAPPRSGKSMLADISIPWIKTHEPGDVLWIFHRALLAKEHAERRALKVLRSVEEIKAMLPHPDQDRTSEIIFADMAVYLRGQAMDNLQSKGFRYVILDECWRYKPGTIAEAAARLGEFLKQQISKLICISQGGWEDDEWDQQYRTGELNEWFIECARCNHFMLPLWNAYRPDGTRWGIVWNEYRREGDFWDINRCLSTVRFECEKCAHPHIDGIKTKAEWNRTGKYLVVGDPNRNKKSFHWSAIIDFPWVELLDIYLKGRNANRQGSPAASQKFWQKQMAQMFSLTRADLRRPIIELYDSPACGAAKGWKRFLTVDCQADLALFFCVIRDWCIATGESRRVWRGQCRTFEQIRERQEEHGVQDQNTFLDIGYEQRKVFQQCVRFGHWGIIGRRRIWLCWIGLKGTDDFDFLHLETHPQTRNQVKTRRIYSPIQYGDPSIGRNERGSHRAPFFFWSNEQVKDELQSRRDGKAGAKWLAPAVPPTDTAEEEEYIAQLNSERKRPVLDKTTNRERWKWVKISATRRNHYWDDECEQIVAAAILGILGETSIVQEMGEG
ncbi:MAG TPA: terminase gpA endonuclease subunit [Pyrinomonadaceae bacterium]|nr:terminase gpA endonuclease subunit [Pyrinomonadaceae bacterium]